MHAAPTAPRSRSIDLTMLIAGTGIVAIGMLVVRDGAVPEAERSVFEAINGLPDWLYPAVWPVQQLGALALGPVVAVVALLVHRRRLAVAVIIVTVLKLVSERLVKAAVTRSRPATSIGADVELRGDVPLDGESFVSGHAVLVAGIAGIVTAVLPGRWKVVPWVLVIAVMFGRVYVGAHNPLDVVGGAALGVAIAGLVGLALTPGASSATPAPPAPTDHRQEVSS